MLKPKDVLVGACGQGHKFRGCDTPQQINERNSQGNCIHLQCNDDIKNCVVYNNSSAHFYLDFRSLSVLEWDFLSNGGLQAYDTKMMGQRSILPFLFQVRGSVFLQNT